MASNESVPNNVYTVLTVIALIALLAGVIFVAVRSNELFGTWNPLDAKELSALVPAGLQSMLG